MTRSDTLHPGATLRLLRTDSGIGLRDLARRIKVSSAYLSRLENGHDPAPTTERLAALARELSVPLEMLLDIAPRIDHSTVEYLESEPEAMALLAEIAHRRLDSSDLRKLRRIIEREFPLSKNKKKTNDQPRLAPFLTESSVLVDLICSDIEDAMDVALERLSYRHALPNTNDTPAYQLLNLNAQSANPIGKGVALSCITGINAVRSCALLILGSPINMRTPDNEPVKLIVVIAGPPVDLDRREMIVHIAGLAARDLANALGVAQTSLEAINIVKDIELKL